LAIQLGSVSWPQKRVPMDATHGLTVLVALLALLGVIYAAWPIWRALFPMEIGLNEPWNAFYAELARQGGVLYPSAGALSANDYPPLSFYFIGMLTALTDGDAIYLGRFLSFVAVAIVALCTAACVRLFAGTRLAATVAAFARIARRTHRHYRGRYWFRDLRLAVWRRFLSTAHAAARLFHRGKPCQHRAIAMDRSAASMWRPACLPIFCKSSGQASRATRSSNSSPRPRSASVSR